MFRVQTTCTCLTQEVLRLIPLHLFSFVQGRERAGMRGGGGGGGGGLIEKIEERQISGEVWTVSIRSLRNYQSGQSLFVHPETTSLKQSLFVHSETTSLHKVYSFTQKLPVWTESIRSPRTYQSGQSLFVHSETTSLDRVYSFTQKLPV